MSNLETLRKEYLESIKLFTTNYFTRFPKETLVEDLYKYYRASKFFDLRFNINAFAGTSNFSRHLGKLANDGHLIYVNCGCGGYGKYKLNK